MWKLTNNQWVKEEVTRKIRKYFEMNEMKNTRSQTLQDIVKAVLRNKCIAKNAIINKEETIKNSFKTQENEE